MKRYLITILLIFSVSRFYAQENRTTDSKEVVSYLVRNVLLPNWDSGGVVLIPHPAIDIRHYEPTIEVKYWGILHQYFPGISRDSLYRKVHTSPWIDTTARVPGLKIYFPKVNTKNNFDYGAIFKQYKVPVFSVSNMVFSNDRTSCILYLAGFEAGAFTVEIKKDDRGKWISHKTTADWIE